MMQVPSIPLMLVSMQAPLISYSTRPKKLLFFRKAAAIIMIVGLTQNYGAYGQTICERPPFTLNSKKCAKKGWEILLWADSVFLSTYSTPGTWETEQCYSGSNVLFGGGTQIEGT